MWVRDTLEDLTAAEFGLSLQQEEDEVSAAAITTTPRRRKRAVDYEKLLSQLNRRLHDMGLENFEDAAAKAKPTLTLDKGMGSIVYNLSQREALLAYVCSFSCGCISFRNITHAFCLSQFSNLGGFWQPITNSQKSSKDTKQSYSNKQKTAKPTPSHLVLHFQRLNFLSFVSKFQKMGMDPSCMCEMTARWTGTVHFKIGQR
jgi:hypothetical protein